MYLPELLFITHSFFSNTFLQCYITVKLQSLSVSSFASSPHHMGHPAIQNVLLLYIQRTGFEFSFYTDENKAVVQNQHRNLCGFWFITLLSLDIIWKQCVFVDWKEPKWSNYSMWVNNKHNLHIIIQSFKC